MENKKIILFDGVCHLCNTYIQFIIKRDKNKELYFASLQSELGQSLLKKYNLRLTLNTVILIKDHKVYTKSDVAILTFPYLGALWPVLSILYYIPRFIRDNVYDLIAKYRYQWFGKKEACMIPTPDIKSRFLDV